MVFTVVAVVQSVGRRDTSVAIGPLAWITEEGGEDEADATSQEPGAVVVGLSWGSDGGLLGRLVGWFGGGGGRAAVVA
jgi:hypothetical protein